jgi:hypothetical protein
MTALWLRVRGWLAILRRRWFLALISMALIAVVALAFINPRLMISPGALMPAHAELSTDCFACHAPLRGVSAQRCVSCHAVADIGLRTSTGKAIAPTTTLSFHQELIEQDCMACHSDHSSPRLVGERGVKPFSHDLLRPATRPMQESQALGVSATESCAQIRAEGTLDLRASAPRGPTSAACFPDAAARAAAVWQRP